MEGVGTSQGGFSFSYVGIFLQGTKFKKQEECVFALGMYALKETNEGIVFLERRDAWKDANE